MSKAKALRELAADERGQQLRDRLKEQFELKKTKATGKLENPLQLRRVRRDIARLLTVQNEKRNGKETEQGAHGNTARKA